MEMPSAHWEDQLPMMWEVVWWWLREHQVFIMIGTAVSLAMAILTMIVGLFERQDDDDDFDYIEYD